MRATDPRAQTRSALLVTMRGCVQFSLGTNDASSTERTGENQFSHWGKSSFPCTRTPITVTAIFGLLTHYMGSRLE